jgi:structure-specific endonuclease subunit SLX1
MVLIIHGFPNDISALRFEWAWQHPDKSRRLDASRKKKGESVFSYKIRILSKMLRTGPWNRLPLTIRWLKQEYKEDFPPSEQPPRHMAIAYGPIDLQKSKESVTEEEAVEPTSPVTLQQCCDVCYQTFKEDENGSLVCYHKPCKMIGHVLCLAKLYFKDGMLIPIAGNCVLCGEELLWGELIRRYKSRRKP